MCRNHRKATCIEPRSGQEQDRKYKQVSICFAKNKRSLGVKHVAWVMTFSYVYLVLYLYMGTLQLSSRLKQVRLLVNAATLDLVREVQGLPLFNEKQNSSNVLERKPVLQPRCDRYYCGCGARVLTHVRVFSPITLHNLP